ncbi:amino acid deaminase [Microbacterium sp. NM3R9]|uniref:amino acid deaminase n=1 Tax=Microbacterium thalli TaxID=3027921 RepID=UPI002365801A|nr:amino acid deaminase [Microbacterium thalli]MDN8548178.1 amino acid deaminase [Microbacterium thalli]
MNGIRRLDEASAAASAGDLESAWAAVPWLPRAIAADAASGLFALWARSTIVDENVGAPVLSRGVFERLHREAGLTADWPIGNAGLLHVYGYLLSTTPTPYGLKRERWLGADLAAAFGLDDDAFLPWRPGPSLLTRVTAAALALLDTAPVRRDERAGTFRVALSAASGPAALVYARAVASDHVAGSDSAGSDSAGSDSAGSDSAGSDSAGSDSAGVRLVTTFPVTDAAALLAALDAEPDRVRWNAAG